MGTEHKIIKIIRIALTIGAIAMLIGASLIFLNASNVRKNYEPTIAEIVGIKTSGTDWRHHHSVYVTYTYEGTLYEKIQYGSYDKTMRIGRTIPIYVDPTNPSDAESGSFSAITLLVPVAILFLFFAKNLNKIVGGGASSKTIKGLKERGVKIEAYIERIEENQNIKINGKRPFRIHCRYDDSISGNTYHFVSNNVYGFEQSAFSVGNSVPVYVDSTDYNKYFVDISFETILASF